MIYPPILQSTQVAFPAASTPVYPIKFDLQSIGEDDVTVVQVRIVYQDDNSHTIGNITAYPDGNIYKNGMEKDSSGQYFVNITRADLNEDWIAGQLYKVQVRFSTGARYPGASGFATWKQNQIEAIPPVLSEWSTVMLIKAIGSTTIEIQNAGSVKDGVESTTHTEPTLTPLFTGNAVVGNEIVDKYKFNLYEGQVNLDDPNLSHYQLDTSGWVQHTNKEPDSWRFKMALEKDAEYTVSYEIETKNGYTARAPGYFFMATQIYLSDLENISIRVDDKDSYCKENGCINIYCTTHNDAILNGNYVITRSSERSNFTVWEDISYLIYQQKSLTDELIYQDFTVESGIKYKYAFQQENSEKLRSSPLYEENNHYHYVDFEYSYLYRNGVQLRLQFNQQMQSFKHTTLRTKQDTLGDKYPHLVQNGRAYYAEFPVNGLISLQMDEDQTFFTPGVDGYYHNGELVIPRDKFEQVVNYRDLDDNSMTISTNLTPNNIFIERAFREKVEEFLNDFTPKLYKSATEGNIVVGLMNVSLTPESTLGRMIFSFSATAYEVLENTLENLDEHGIINIGHYMPLTNDSITKSFGQVRGIYGSDIDAYKQIVAQENISIPGGYRMNMTNLNSIWVEQYPKLDFTGDMLELQANKAAALNEGNKDLANEIQAQINSLTALEGALSGPLATTSILEVNGARVLVRPNKVYTLNEPITSLTVISAVAPIIINYTCDLTLVQDDTVGVVSKVDASRIWGQISGVFTGTKRVLQSYDYDYKSSPTYRIYNPTPTRVTLDARGNILVDDTTYNVYKTINIYDIIKEETQKQVEFIYKTRFKLDEHQQLTDGTVYYEFGDLIKFDIEADPGTVLLIGKAVDGSDATETLIGPTGRYLFRPGDNRIRYIALRDPQFCVINYQCLTSQMTMKKAKGGA